MKHTIYKCIYCGNNTTLGQFCPNCGYFAKKSITLSHSPIINKPDYAYYKGDFNIESFDTKDHILKKYNIYFITCFSTFIVFLVHFVTSLFFLQSIRNLFGSLFTELCYISVWFFIILFLLLGIKFHKQKKCLNVLDNSSGYALFYDSMQKPLKVLVGDTFYFVSPKSLCQVCNKKIFIAKYNTNELIVLCSNEENNRHFYFIDTIKLKSKILNHNH